MTGRELTRRKGRSRVCWRRMSGSDQHESWSRAVAVIFGLGIMSRSSLLQQNGGPGQDQCKQDVAFFCLCHHPSNPPNQPRPSPSPSHHRLDTTQQGVHPRPPPHPSPPTFQSIARHRRRCSHPVFLRDKTRSLSLLDVELRCAPVARLDLIRSVAACASASALVCLRLDAQPPFRHYVRRGKQRAATCRRAG